MKASITTFPSGTAEGLPVLRLDFEGGAWATEQADAALGRNSGARGIWGVWLDGLASWEAPQLDVWIRVNYPVISLRKLGETDWPAADPAIVLDFTEALEHAHDIDELANFVAKHAQAMPEVTDVVARVVGRAPTSNALDLLASFAQPIGQCFLYAPADHPQRPLMVRAVSQCLSQWSLRSSG